MVWQFDFTGRGSSSPMPPNSRSSTVTGQLCPHPGEVLFERICRQDAIQQPFTGVRSPTATSKIERSTARSRTEFLLGKVFATLQTA
jgi:hypothetical protein